ncbi:MAG: hypothetical protein ACFCVK_19505 [Acidimicrobiales bacterium]
MLAYDGTPEQFGPLAPAPALAVVLPGLDAVDPDGTATQVRTVARLVNGGSLVGLSSGTDAEADSAVLAVVEPDGIKRWVRCLPGTAVNAWVAAPAQQPRTALVATYRNTTLFVADWQLIALDTGETTPGFTEAAARAGVDPSTLATASVADVSPTAVLLSRAAADPGTGGVTSDLLVRYLLAEETFSVVAPLPAGGDGFVEYELGPGDDIVARTFESGVVAVHRDGEWRRDDATRLAAQPIEVRFHLGDDPASLRSLEGVDALGTVIWRNDELTGPSLEGLGIVTDGPVALANVSRAAS